MAKERDTKGRSGRGTETARRSRHHELVVTNAPEEALRMSLWWISISSWRG
jgi:hypothetical protein